MARTPVYFLSHGGPNLMFDRAHPAYKKLQAIGRDVTGRIKPRAVVVFSAHWQAEKTKVHVNTAEGADLIYDFYNFPKEYYQVKYPNVGSNAVAQRVLDLLQTAGIGAKGSLLAERSVYVEMSGAEKRMILAAFDPEKNPLHVPIVQVSLFDSDNADQHYRLGQAVAALREENIAIIVSGMAVHNLGDFFRRVTASRDPLPYTVSFDEALRDATTAPPTERQAKMAALLTRPDARQAHPGFDHLLPIHVGAGAAGDDVGERLWTLGEGSMSWAQYRFGDVPAG
ncbi:MAG: hypothetical protein M1825_002594 [Sarcosagium campestre]|nr:MAG: hypothetical protein M1825_002594 [Sarcosagium campestre]